MGLALTIGNFDGVHLGHRDLIARLTGYGLNTHVITFEPHPVEILYPERKQARLFTFEDQENELKKLGVGQVIVQNFTQEFSKIPATEFLEKYIFARYHPKQIVVGHDFSFGAGKEGQHELLQKISQAHHCKVEIVPAFKVDGEIVSSSLIRQSLLSADVKKAARLLGRNYYLKGSVIQGAQRGRTIGVPTANMQPEVGFIPKHGVYVAKARLSSEEEFLAVVNIGINKTFVHSENAPVKMEAHLLNFNKDIYGQDLEIHFLHYLRDEKKFASIDDLKKQIAVDIDSARRLSI